MGFDDRAVGRPCILFYCRITDAGLVFGGMDCVFRYYGTDVKGIYREDFKRLGLDKAGVGKDSVVVSHDRRHVRPGVPLYLGRVDENPRYNHTRA